MRIGAGLLACVLALAGCNRAPVPPETSVRKVFGQYEQALRTGDAKLLCSIYVAELREGPYCRDLLATGIQPRKDLKLGVDEVVVRKWTAAVFARKESADDSPFVGLLFTREGDDWRLVREAGAAGRLYRPAFIPPETGRFLEAGSPWHRVEATPIHRRPGGGPVVYSARFALDESFLYISLTSPREFPPVGNIVPTPTDGLPELGFPPLPAMKLRVTERGQTSTMVVGLDSVVQTRSLGGGREYRLSYVLAVGPEGKTPLFSVLASTEQDLLRVHGTRLTAKIPRESLTTAPDASFSVELGTPPTPTYISPRVF